MPICAITEETLRQAAEIIRGGGLVAFPTETVYGLGADAGNPSAIAQIFEAKGRPRFDPLIVHIAAQDTLETIADTGALDTAARNNLAALAGQFWPGSLTLILPKRHTVPDIATSGLPTVAVRVPANNAARRLIALSTGAIAAPSANPFGYLSPTRAEHVLETLGGKVGCILDGGPAQVGLESTVLDICSGQPRLLRPGAVPTEAIEALIGPVASGSPADNAHSSPGMLKSHYAPGAVLTVHDILPALSAAGGALLFFDGASRDAWLSAAPVQPAPSAVCTLSETGNLPEAAARLFELLHELDKRNVRHIYAQLAPEHGLGAAINDRLRRASAR